MKLLLTIIAISTFAVNPVFAQPGRGGFGGGGPGTPGSSALESAGLKVGSSLPDITIYDAEGNPVRMKDMKGKHSVIVFGCLT